MKFAFDPDCPVERAPTPPASWYVEKEFLKLEKENVFGRSWQPVGVTAHVAKPGEYFSGRFMEKTYIVVRDADGELRAFHNVCRHHAAELAHGRGCLKKLICPYHGWSYSLDGELLNAPRTQGIECFDAADFGLRAIPVKAVGPFLWLDFGGGGAGPEDRFADVWKRLEASGWDKLKFHTRRSYEMRCNWKVYVDNYLDGGYHVAILHKQLTGQLKLSDYRTEVAGEYSIQSCSGKENERIGSGAFYAWLYPNFMINRYGPVMDTNWVIPLSEDRCLTVFDFFFEETEGEKAEKFIAQSLSMSERVQQEDIQISESVQRGLESGAYTVGRYAPQVEHAMHAFHRRLARDLVPFDGARG